MSRKRHFPIVLVVLLLSGCIRVGPDFVRPKATVSPSWFDAGDPRVKAEVADYRAWWKAFNDPVLDRLIDTAYRNNLSLRIAGMRVLEARAQLGITAGEIYPQTQQITGSVQYNRPSEKAAQPGGGKSYLLSQVGIGAAWELDFWGKFRRAIESDSAAWLATVADYDNALVSLTSDVAGAYIRIRTLEKRLAIARENATTQQENLEIAEAKFRFGASSQLDANQANTLLNDTLASIPAFEAQLRQAKHSLGVLLALPPGDPKELLPEAGDIPASPPQVIVGIPLDLLRRRPDIRSAELQAAAQNARIGVAEANLYPAFSLIGNFGFLSTDIGTSSLSDMFRWGSRTITAGPTVQWNIFNYGRITNNVRLQDARFQELLIAYQGTVLTAQREVEDNLVAFLKAQDRASLLARSTSFAKDTLDLAVLQYREGAKDFITVLTAQQALLDEQDKLAVTLGDISTSLVGVYRALGGGWEIRQGDDLVPAGVREEMAKRTNWGRLLIPGSYNPSSFEKPSSSVRSPDW